jgi:hypothetical protein
MNFSKSAVVEPIFSHPGLAASAWLEQSVAAPSSDNAAMRRMRDRFGLESDVMFYPFVIGCHGARLAYKSLLPDGKSIAGAQRNPGNAELLHYQG